MSDPIIQCHQLSKHFRLGDIGAGSLREEFVQLWSKLRGGQAEKVNQEFKALDRISFEVRPGEILGVVGRNGAGKSTLLKVLSRITEPTSGEVTLRGKVASLLEVGTGFHPELSGRENIFLSGAVLGMSKQEIRQKFDAIVQFAEVEKFIDSPIKRYSSGMAVRLGFAVAAHLDSDILIIDEVLAVGDVNFQEKCLNKMAEIRSSGRTILFVSHNPISIEMLCHRCILLEQGQLIFSGTPREVLDRYHEICNQRILNRSSSENQSAFTGVELWQDGKVCQEPDIAKALTIRLNIKLPCKWPPAHANLQLRTRAQSVVFSVVSPHACEPLSDSSNDSFSIDCQLPENFLNASHYSLAAFMLSPNGKVLDSWEHALEFNTIENPRMRPINFTGDWIGALRPTFQWNISENDSD